MFVRQPKPVFLTDAAGHKTHAIIPYEEWELLATPLIEPDDLDLQTIKRLERDRTDHPEDFEEAPITNPLRKARLAAQIRQQDLAAALKISQPALSKMEREGHALRPQTVARVLAAIELLATPPQPTPFLRQALSEHSNRVRML
jgi:DNA-binding XRE family transcriptional regulator